MEIQRIERSEQINELLAALCKARAKFDPIVKDKTAEVKSERTGGVYRYKYADLADVLDSTVGHLSDNGLVLMQPPVTTSNGRAGVQTILAHVSGQYISGTLELPTLGEKATPQQFGSLITYWRRYAACSFLGIASQLDDDDGKAASKPAAEVMDQSKLADHLAAIEAAADVDTLKKAFFAAQAAAGRDKTALARITSAKAARYKAIAPKPEAAK